MNNKFMVFERASIADQEYPSKEMKFENNWFIGSVSGCSCAFRHEMYPELGFTEPQDWSPEDEEDVEATKQLYDILKNLLNDGAKIEIIDKWAGTTEDKINAMNVSFSVVSRNEFRLFENYRFIIEK